MKSLAVLALLVVAAAAVDLIKKDDKVQLRCEANAAKIIVKDRMHTAYNCMSEDNDVHIYFAPEAKIDGNFDAWIDKETTVVLKAASAKLRPKRQFGFGGAGSHAQSSAGSFGGGGGFGTPLGGFGGGVGGSFAQSNAAAGAGGGGFGGPGFYG